MNEFANVSVYILTHSFHEAHTLIPWSWTHEHVAKWSWMHEHLIPWSWMHEHVVEINTRILGHFTNEFANLNVYILIHELNPPKQKDVNLEGLEGWAFKDTLWMSLRMWMYIYTNSIYNVCIHTFTFANSSMKCPRMLILQAPPNLHPFVLEGLVRVWVYIHSHSQTHPWSVLKCIYTHTRIPWMLMDESIK